MVTSTKGAHYLSLANPALAAEGDGTWDPNLLTLGSNKKVGWRCVKGHLWEASIYSRSAGAGCPYCSGHRAIAGETDLATINPSLSAEGDGTWDPRQVSCRSNKKVGWVCAKGHRWVTRINDRSRGRGCPYCSGNRVIIGETDLATLSPTIATECDGTWDPRQVSCRSNKKVGWVCTKNHRWVAAISKRSRGDGCPYCSGHRVLQGYNDLATLNPKLASESDGTWDPRVVAVSSHEKASWRCTKGHLWAATINSRSRGRGCPYCSGWRAISGETDLSTINPELAAEGDGTWDPRLYTAMSNKSVGWKCKSGHSWSAIIANRSKGVGCPSCATRGFDPHKEGWLYLMRHRSLGLLQIGISNVIEDRIKRHTLDGFELVDAHGPIPGSLARTWETSIKRYLVGVRDRSRKIPAKGKLSQHVTTSATGSTEIWYTDELEVSSLRELMELAKKKD